MNVKVVCDVTIATVIITVHLLVIIN